MEKSRNLLSIYRTVCSVLSQSLTTTLSLESPLQITLQPCNKATHDYQCPSLVKLFNELKKEGKSTGTAKELCLSTIESVQNISIVEKAYESNNGQLFIKLKVNNFILGQLLRV